MIRLYKKGETDYSHNGLMILDKFAESCQVTEELNGTYEAELVLGFDSRLNRIQNDMVLKIPCPTRETPLINMVQKGTQEVLNGHTIWRVNITTSGSGGYSRVYAQPTTDSKVLEKLSNGTEYVYLGSYNNSWHRATGPNGATGYMYTPNSVYARTEQIVNTGPSYNTVVKPRVARDQLFRIYKVDSQIAFIKVYARHISYDLINTYIKTLDMKNASAIEAVTQLFNSSNPKTQFNGYCDMTGRKNFVASRKSVYEAIFSEDGFLSTYNAKILRDNFDIFMLESIGYDRGVTIAYRKNMTEMTVTVDDSEVVTRVIPVGYNRDGSPWYLSALYRDSPHINDYDTPRIAELDCRDLQVGKEVDGVMLTREGMVGDRLWPRAGEFFDGGADLPKVTATADYVDLLKVVPKEAREALNVICLGDTIYLRHEDYGFDLPMPVVATVWDAIAQTFISLDFGETQVSMSNLKLNAKLIPDGELSGRKLGIGTVEGQLIAPDAISENKIQDGAVTWVKIGNLAVDTAKIQDAAITKAKIAEAAIGEAQIEDAAITTAKIKDAQIDYTKIKDATITKAKMDEASIGEAQIEDMAVSHAKIALAAIGKANLQEAIIGTAHIEEGAIDTATIRDGAITNAKIALLAVEEGNIKDLAVTRAKIAAAAIGSAEIEMASIDTAHIVLGAITTALIAKGAVGTAQIADASIDDAKIVELNANKINAGTLSVERLIIVGAENSIVYTINEANGTPQLSGTTIDGGSLTERSITADRIIAGSITANEIAAASILANHIAAEQIEGGHIVSSTIEAHHLKAGSIETSHISAGARESLLLEAGQAIDLAVGQVQNEQQELESRLTQTAGDIQLKFDSIRDQTVEVDGDLQAFKELVRTNIRFSDAGIEIGKLDSQFTARFDNEELGFYQNGRKIAYFSNNELFVIGAQTQKMTIGDETKGFVDLTVSKKGLMGKFRSS